MDDIRPVTLHAIPRRRWRFILVATTLAAVLLAAPLASRSTPTVDAVPLPDVTDTGGHLGSCYAFYDVGDQMLAPRAFAAGSRWDRFDFRWNVIEGEEERQQPFFFDAHDTVVDRDVAAGLDVIGILGSTPKWAAPGCHVAAMDSPQLPPELAARPFVSPLNENEPYWWRPCPPEGLDLPWDDPGNLWGNFVYQTVLHFRDRVHVWEIWNEPDLGGTFWTGTVEDYAQLLRVGYQAVKAADADATVLFAGLAYWYNPNYYISVFDVLTTLEGAPDNNHYFDVLSLHLYSNIYTFGPETDKIRANMEARVGPHPIWLTETGVPLWDEWPTLPDPPQSARVNRATAEEAAAYVIEGFAEARAAGIDKFIFFRTHDDGMLDGAFPANFGLIRDNLTYRPSYVAFQVAAQHLHGENQVSGPFTGDGARRVTFWGTPRGRIDVLWNTTGTPLTVTQAAVVPSAALVDHRGATTALTADAGGYTLTLEPATANTASDGSYIIGGPPVLLIQADPELPRSAMHSLPALSFGRTVTVTWDAGDDISGYWYAEVERATTAGGPWELAAGWPATVGSTSAALTMPSGGLWHFRARARDNVGNWEAWPDSPETSTTVWLTRTVRLSVSAYLDANANGLWDADETEATQARLVWRDGTGTTVAETLGASWDITRTIEGGLNILDARLADQAFAIERFAVIPGTTPVSVELIVGLRPVRGRAYLPVIEQHD